MGLEVDLWIYGTGGGSSTEGYLGISRALPSLSPQLYRPPLTVPPHFALHCRCRTTTLLRPQPLQGGPPGNSNGNSNRGAAAANQQQQGGAVVRVDPERSRWLKAKNQEWFGIGNFRSVTLTSATAAAALAYNPPPDHYSASPAPPYCIGTIRSSSSMPRWPARMSSCLCPR